MSPEILKSAAQRVDKALNHLVFDEPFFGVCALKLKIVVDPSCDTAWTDSVSLGYNPEFVNELTTGELMGLICHEVLHVADGHCWRRGGRDPGIWNEACDYAINPVVLKSYPLPKGGLLEPAYAGKAPEMIYGKLTQPKPPTPPKPQPSPQAGSEKSDKDPQTGEGDKSGEKGKESKGAGSPKDAKADDGASESKGKGGAPGKPQGKPDKGQGGAGEGTPTGSSDDSPDGAGSGAAGDPKKDQTNQGSGNSQDKSQQDASSRPGDKPKRREGPAGEVRDAPSGMNPDELEAEWKITLGMAAKAAQMRGRFPGELAGLVAQAVKPKMDWRAVLRQFFQQSWNAVDYTWRLPSTRYMSQGLYLPRLASETIPCIVLAEDISGSVPAGMKADFHAEERVILDEIQPEEAHLVLCDAKVRKVTVIRPGDPIELVAVTAGGTDFRPVFEWVEEQGLNVAALVYLTDLDGTVPEEPPSYPVLWVSPPTRHTVPFGDLVEMRD
jgi:predicted metal-dependent peptidase